MFVAQATLAVNYLKDNFKELSDIFCGLASHYKKALQLYLSILRQVKDTFLSSLLFPKGLSEISYCIESVIL